VFNLTAFAYDQQSLPTTMQVGYDLVAGQYSVIAAIGLYQGLKFREPLPAREWTPDALAGAGIR
jgi:hypothetical protein